MKWKIEDIGIHAHIVVDDEDETAVVVGMPVELAKSIIKRHNDSLDELQNEINGLMGNCERDHAPLYFENKDLLNQRTDAVSAMVCYCGPVTMMINESDGGRCDVCLYRKKYQKIGGNDETENEKNN